MSDGGGDGGGSSKGSGNKGGDSGGNNAPGSYTPTTSPVSGDVANPVASGNSGSGTSALGLSDTSTNSGIPGINIGAPSTGTGAGTSPYDVSSYTGISGIGGDSSGGSGVASAGGGAGADTGAGKENLFTAAPASGPAPVSGLPGVGGGGAVDPTSQVKSGGGGDSSGGMKNITDSLGIKNPLGAGIGAAGLGYAMSSGQKAAAFTPQMQAQAAALNSQGQQLLSYLQSGTLPAGLQASLTQATSAAKAKIISNFASQGLNTDPTQNSALQAELAQVDQQALISTAQIGQQLMTTGLQESGMSSDLYKTLANIDQTQTANIGKAIANFASSISGSGGGTTIKLGG